MKQFKLILLSLWLAPAMASGPDLSGLSPEAAGRALTDYAEEVHAGWKSSISTAHMRMFDISGKVSEQSLKIYALEQKTKNDGGRSFIVYDEEGTGLLTYMSRDKPDVQWVWVPGLKKKFRIQANNMSGAFLGSEFSYEDFRTQYPEKFDIKLLREDEADGHDCWVLERIPTKRITNYSRQEVYMDKKHYRVIKTDFFDKNGSFLKTLLAVDWEKRPDGFWRSARGEMINHQTGRISWLINEDVQLNTGMSSLNKYLR